MGQSDGKMGVHKLFYWYLLEYQKHQFIFSEDQDLQQYLNAFKVFGGIEYEIQNQETERSLSRNLLGQHQSPALLKATLI